MKKLFRFIALAPVLFACKDPNVKYNQVIQNDSDYDVSVKVYNRTDSAATVFFTVDSFLIAKKSETIILERNGYKNMSVFNPCNMYLDSIKGYAEDTTLILTKNLNSAANYTFTEVSKNKKGGGTCECRTIFKNSDLH